MKPGKVQKGKDTHQTLAAPAPYSLPGMSGGRSISGKENNMTTKKPAAPTHTPGPQRPRMEAPWTCDICHEQLPTDEAVKSHKMDTGHSMYWPTFEKRITAGIAVHTPGPWTVRPVINSSALAIEAKDGFLESVSAVWCENRGREVGSANARLIAAAPDLLAASQKALWSLEQWANSKNGPLANELRAAIAKAEGREGV